MTLFDYLVRERTGWRTVAVNLTTTQMMAQRNASLAAGQSSALFKFNRVTTADTDVWVGAR